jgi:hypothetical protein
MRLLAAYLFVFGVLCAPVAHADPNTPGPQPPGYSCTQTGKTYPTFVPCPGDVVGPLRGGGNHRWTDGSDD